MKKSLFERIADRMLDGPVARKIYTEQVKRELCMLHPATDPEEICRKYYREKISLMLKVLSAGVLLLLAIVVSEHLSAPLTEGYRIQRNEEGGGSRQMNLEIRSEEKGSRKITYELPEKMYTPGQIETLTERFLSEYEELIRGENESLQKVQKDLVLQEMYEGYPMSFDWESSDYGLVGDDGTVTNEELSYSQPVTLTARITYGENVYEHNFPVCVIPPVLSQEQLWEKEILTQIRKADDKQKYEAQLSLPEKIGGSPVQYFSVKDPGIFYILLVFPLVPVVLYKAKDKDLKKETEEKKKRMTLKYPEFVSKFRLLLGAGVSVRNVCFRLREDPTLGEDLQEELELLCRDMKNGTSAGDALDRFGKRTSHPLYIKFSALLVQNLKKGTDDLLEQLSAESAQAFLLRKSNARQLGEEAGTKLLLPMILMLTVVMAVLMIPAFISFQL